MRIVINNQFLMIEGNRVELNLVKDLLTFKDNSAEYTLAYRFYKWDGLIRLYRDGKEGTIISYQGLAEYLLDKLGKKVEVIDKRDKLDISSSYDLVGIKLRDYQEEAVKQALIKQRGIILVPTAGGKTYIASAILKGFRNYKCVYIVHRVVLLSQVKKVLENSLGEEIGVIWRDEVDIEKRVVVAMINSLYIKSKTDDRVKRWMGDVKVCIGDEVQRFSGKSFISVMNGFSNLVVRIGMTGTLPEDIISMLRIKGLFGEVIYKIEAEELFRRGYVSVPVVKMIYGSWDVNLRSIFRGVSWGRFDIKREIWEKVRMKGIIENDRRNEIIVRIVRGYLNKGVKGILVICDLIDHGILLKEKLGAVFIWSGSEEKVKILEQFKNNKIDILISSPIIDEGIDIEKIKVIVLASGGKSKIRLLQRIGRGMRRADGKFDVDIVDFYDCEVPLLERHSRRRLEVYREFGYRIEKVNAEQI